MKGFVLGIDFGTSSVKVMCVSREGDSSTAVTPYERRPGMDPETDPEAWWMAMGKGLRTLAPLLAEGRIHAIGLTAQVGTYLLQDGSKTGGGLSVTSWRNGSGEKELNRVRSRFSEQFFNEHISMNHPKLASYPIPRVLHFAGELPREWERAEKLLQPKDYIYWRLTGTYASDPYSWRGLANLADCTFHEELLNQIGMAGEKLPPLFMPGEAPGHLLKDIADELGIPCGLPVYVGCSDFFSSLFGMGIMKEDQRFDVTGTSEHIGMVTGRAKKDEELISGPYLRHCVQYGVTANSGASMAWAFRTFGGGPEWGSLANRLSGCGSSPPPVFLPYLRGERAPVWDSKARGVFFGLSDGHHAEDLVYSVLEGVVFSLYHIWTRMAGGAGTEIRSGGGAAADEGLNRLKSSMLRMPFCVMREKESGSLGAAMFAAIGTGWFSSADEAIANWVKVDHVVEPDENLGETLRSRFAIYEDLYPALKETFGKWATIGASMETGVGASMETGVGTGIGAGIGTCMGEEPIHGF